MHPDQIYLDTELILLALSIIGVNAFLAFTFPSSINFVSIMIFLESTCQIILQKSFIISFVGPTI